MPWQAVVEGCVICIHCSVLRVWFCAKSSEGLQLKYALAMAVGVIFTVSAHAGCYESKTMFGTEIKCSDGNEYQIRQNRGMFYDGSTSISGSNSRTGSQWNQEITNGQNPSMYGTNKPGQSYNCKSIGGVMWSCR